MMTKFVKQKKWGKVCNHTLNLKNRPTIADNQWSSAGEGKPKTMLQEARTSCFSSLWYAQ